MEHYVEVVGWEEFQHYKDRDPVWIKLHRTLLDNYEYSRLQDASKSHLIGIWLLAARHKNRIPADVEWIEKRIGATSPVDLQVLVNAGLIRVLDERGQDASISLALARSREERRGEENRKEKDVAAAPRREKRASRKASPDQLPETLDEAIEKAPKVTWLTPLAQPWEAKFGKGSFHFAKWAKQLKPFQPLLGDRPPDEVAQRFARYLATLDKAKFASPVRFCETYEDHGESAQYNTTDPTRSDFVGVIDGWMSPELERLTRPA